MIPNPFGALADWISAPFVVASGWAWDSVIGGLTNWIAKGFVQAVTFVWSLMDRSSTPHLDAAWYSGSANSPYVTAVGVATGLLGVFLMLALIQGVLRGRPGELLARMFRDTPAAIGGILFTVAFAQIAINVSDAISDGIWTMTRPNAVTAVDGLLVTASKLSSNTFLAPLLMLVGTLGMLLLWVVMLVRESLVYLVVALCPLAWAASVWPALASVRRRTLELLAGLILSKVAIALALSVGLGALGGVGTTGNPGGGTVDNGLAEFGTLASGVVVFGMAAFMPFLVIKLLPIVEGAAIAQGLHAAPVRAAMQGMQYAYYLQGIGNRLAGPTARAGTSLPGASDDSGPVSTVTARLAGERPASGGQPSGPTA